MRFFERQRQAKQRTTLLLGLFALAVLSIVLAVDLVVLLVFGFTAFPGADWLEGAPPWLLRWAPHRLREHAQLLAWTTLTALGVIALASHWRLRTLRQGGGAVARALGGTLVAADTRDPLRRRLLNLVEEMAIAAGVPVPEVYVLEAEPGINAFAAGYTPADAAVTVTRGALETLDRDELQGVVAHELAHVLNGDMRLNQRLVGLLFGILALGLVGRILLGTRRATALGGRFASASPWRGRLGSRGRGLSVAILLGMALMALGWIGLFFGRLIRAAVSRQREYLADAAAVQFTRHPAGLAGALKKIGALGAGSALTVDSEEIGHMLFARGFHRQWLATHPPLLERIRAIEPGFDPRELDALRARLAAAGAVPVGSDPAVTARPMDTAAGVAAGAGIPAWVEGLGELDLTRLPSATRPGARWPSALERAARSPYWVLALPCYLLTSADPEVAERQRLLVARALGSETEQQLGQLLAAVPRLDPEHRLPLLELAFPALRQQPSARLISLLHLIEDLVAADGQVAVFEYALSRMLMRQLADLLWPSQARPAGAASLASRREAAVAVLELLAGQTHADPAAARAAFAAGLAHLGWTAREVAGGEDGRAWATRLDRHLARLDELRFEDKQRLIGSMAVTLAAGGAVMTLPARELLRTLMAVLHLPAPLPA